MTAACYCCCSGASIPPTERKLPYLFPLFAEMTLPLPLPFLVNPDWGSKGVTPENVNNQDARTCILMHFGISIPIIKF